MLKNIKVYSADIYWNRILTDLGAVMVDSPNVADVIFDDIDISAPISVVDLHNILLNRFDCPEIIQSLFGQYVVLPGLQHRIIVNLYKNPNITINELKNMLGVSPDITSHAVENAIYQLRKNYGHDFIINNDGKYKIGHL